MESTSRLVAIALAFTLGPLDCRERLAGLAFALCVCRGNYFDAQRRLLHQ
jgi:hypothetical protein